MGVLIKLVSESLAVMYRNFRAKSGATITIISEDFIGATVTERFIRHFKFYHEED